MSTDHREAADIHDLVEVTTRQRSELAVLESTPTNLDYAPSRPHPQLVTETVAAGRADFSISAEDKNRTPLTREHPS
jgi:hypothetical protein